MCQHIYDVMGCDWNMPANYSEGVFEECLGDSAQVRRRFFLVHADHRAERLRSLWAFMGHLRSTKGSLTHQLRIRYLLPPVAQPIVRSATARAS